jgi:hypothetical protein
MEKLFEVISKYFNRHFFIVNEKDPINNFKSKLLNYKSQGTDYIGTRYLNIIIINYPLINMIKID